MAIFKLFSSSKSVKSQRYVPNPKDFHKPKKLTKVLNLKSKLIQQVKPKPKNSEIDPQLININWETLSYSLSTIPIIIWILKIMSSNLYAQPHLIKDIFEILENWELFILFCEWSERWNIRQGDLAFRKQLYISNYNPKPITWNIRQGDLAFRKQLTWFVNKAGSLQSARNINGT